MPKIPKALKSLDLPKLFIAIILILISCLAIKGGVNLLSSSNDPFIIFFYFMMVLIIIKECFYTLNTLIDTITEAFHE